MARTNQIGGAPRSRVARGMGIAALVLGLLLVAAGIGYYGWVSYLREFERRTPSTAQLLRLRDGREVPFVQPTQPSLAPTIPAPTASAPIAAAGAPAPEQPTPAAAAPAAPPAPVLPPEQLRIPRIGLDRPVVLGSAEQLPQFPGVGWLLGSAFPGASGNMVLFGHLGGPNGVFQRLSELAPGDELFVGTQQGELRYVVESARETTPDDVSVLLPGDGATATLITCSGPWDAAQQTNERRLIVTARLSAAPQE